MIVKQEEDNRSASTSSSKKRKELELQKQELNKHTLAKNSNPNKSLFKTPKPQIASSHSKFTPPKPIKLEEGYVGKSMPKIRTKVCRKISGILVKKFQYSKPESNKLAVEIERRMHVYHPQDECSYLDAIKGLFRCINSQEKKMSEVKEAISKDITIFGIFQITLRRTLIQMGSTKIIILMY